MYGSENFLGELMKINVSRTDQSLRLFFGILLVAWAVAGGPWWAYIGVVLIITGAWRVCPIYKSLGK